MAKMCSLAIGSSTMLHAQKLAAARGTLGRLAALLNVGMIAVAGLAGFWIWSSYEQEIRSAEKTSQNYAAIIERDFSATLSRIDTHILEFSRSIPDAALDKTAASEFADTLDAALDLRRHRFPELSGLRISDATGEILYSTDSATSPRIDVADRAYFRQARDHREIELVYETTISRANGRPNLMLAKALRTPQGDFRGVVTAAIELKYFQDLFSSLDVGNRGNIAIFRQDDFSTIVQRSANASRNDAPRRMSATERSLIGTGQAMATFDAVSDYDGVPYIASLHALDFYPFAISVALSRDEVLKDWKIRSSLAVGLLVFLAFLAILLRRASNRQQTAIIDLANGEANLRTISDNASVGIVVFVEERCVFANGHVERMLGYDMHEIQQIPIGDLPHPEDRPLMFERHRRRLAGEEIPSRYETRLLAKDGNAIPVEINAAVTKWNGEPAVIAVFSDISARKQAEAERQTLESRLREAQKMEAIGKLTGGMAHDFNNYLGVIIGNLDLLEGLIAKETQASKLLASAMSGALRSADLNRSLLAFARRQPLAPQSVDPNRSVDAVATLLRRTLGEDIALNTDLAPDIWPIWIDASQLDSCIVNLANNARDAMPEGGSLTISTRNLQADDLYAAATSGMVLGDYVLIEITDSGSGMPPETMSQAFEPFFSTKPVGHGTGLGLSMVYGFTKQSGGHVALYSEIGHGTTVRLYLPRHDGAGRTDVAPADKSAALIGGPETILVVEDNIQMRQTAITQLASLGYRVMEAEHGAAALAILDQHQTHIDLLFTDIVMPGDLDGYSLAALAIERRPSIGILLTSGFPRNTMRTVGMDTDGIDLLTKPYRLDHLMNAVRTALNRKRGTAETPSRA